MKNFKSYGFWTALAGAVVMLLNAIGKCFGFTVEEELVTDIIMAIAGILVVFGVVVMPKKDSKQETEDEEKDMDIDEQLVNENGEIKQESEVESENDNVIEETQNTQNNKNEEELKK